MADEIIAHTKVAHTPGPWDDASKYPFVDSVRIFAGTHYIATVGNSDDTREQTEANAHVIAAAPRMLDALRVAADALDNYSDVNDGDDGQPVANRAMSALRDVEAAIALAEGAQ